MEKFIEAWSARFFPQNVPLMLSIAKKELEKPQTRKNGSLAWHCLEVLMKKTHDRYSDEGVYYKIFFNKFLTVHGSCNVIRCMRGVTDHFDASVVDPKFMHRLLENNLQAIEIDEIQIVIQRKSLKMSLDEMVLFEMPTETFEYEYAKIFTDIALRRGVEKVEIVNEESYSDMDIGAWPKRFAANFPLIRKDDPRWADEVRRGRLVYSMSPHRTLMFTDQRKAFWDDPEWHCIYVPREE